MNETEEAILKQCKESGRRKLMIEVIRSRLKTEKENEDIPDDLQNVITKTEKGLLRRLEGTDKTEALVVIRERIEMDKQKEATDKRMRQFRDRFPSCKTDESGNEEEEATTSTKQRKQRTDIRREQQNEEQRDNGMQSNAQMWVKREIQTAYDNMTELMRRQQLDQNRNENIQSEKKRENRNDNSKQHEQLWEEDGQPVVGGKADRRSLMTKEDNRTLMTALKEINKTFHIGIFKGEVNEEPDLYTFVARLKEKALKVGMERQGMLAELFMNKVSEDVL